MAHTYELDLALEIGLRSSTFVLLLSTHSVDLFAMVLKSVHHCLMHISSFASAALRVAMISASVTSPAMMSCLLERQNTQFPCILNTMPETLSRLTLFRTSTSEYTCTTLSTLSIEYQDNVNGTLHVSQCCDIYAHYACVADWADAMADAWEDTSTAGCAHANCLHVNVLKC